MRARVVLGAAGAAVLVPALLLTLDRLADPASGRLVRAESFTPLALPAYAVVLVASLVVLVVLSRRGASRPRRLPAVLVTLVAVAGLALHGYWFSDRVLGANPPPAAGSEPVTVLTANLYGGRADGIELVRLAAEERVDLLVVEEVTAPELAEMDRAGLGALLPHRIGNAATEFGVDGTMVFSRLPLGTPERLPTRNDAWRVEVDGLTLLAVHPVAPTEPASWRADHAAVLAAAKASDADLVVGDFNATLDHRPLRRLAADGWRSVAELANEGWQPTWPANGVIGLLGLPVPSLVQIDHVLVGRRLAALGTHTVLVPGTDHRAVVAAVARK